VIDYYLRRFKKMIFKLKLQIINAERDNHGDRILDAVQVTSIVIRTDDSRLHAVCSAWLSTIAVGQCYCQMQIKLDC